MVDILMIVLVSLAGLLALLLGLIFCPYGALTWFLVAKNAKEAQERREVEDTLEEEVERQYEILQKRKMDLQEPIAVNVDPYEEWHVEGKCSNNHRWHQQMRHPTKTNVPCPICAEKAQTLCVRAPGAWYESRTVTSTELIGTGISTTDIKRRKRERMR